MAGDISVGERVRVHRLDAGDSIRFGRAVRHRIVNRGETELRCIWAIIPPTF